MHLVDLQLVSTPLLLLLSVIGLMFNKTYEETKCYSANCSAYVTCFFSLNLLKNTIASKQSTHPQIPFRRRP